MLRTRPMPHTSVELQQAPELVAQAALIAHEIAERPGVVPQEVVDYGELGGRRLRTGQPEPEGARVAEQEEERHVDEDAGRADQREAQEAGGRQRRQPQTHQVPQVVHVHAPGDLALSLDSLAEHVADLGDPAHAAAADHLDENLVAERVHRRACDRAAADHEVAAHGIADAPEHARQQDQAQELRAAREQAAQEAPVADAAAFDVPAADGEVGPLGDLAPQRDGDLRRMLEVTRRSPPAPRRARPAIRG